MAGGMEGRVELRNGLLGWLRELGTQVNDDAQETALVAADVGAAVIRDRIDTTPSDLSREPKSNRNWTGHMNDRVDSKVTKTGHNYKVQMGWLNVKANEAYFGIQEYGGVVNGKTVTAMSALVTGIDSANYAVEKSLRKKGYK